MQVKKGGEKKAGWEEGFIQGHGIEKFWGQIQSSSSPALCQNDTQKLPVPLGALPRPPLPHCFPAFSLPAAYGPTAWSPLLTSPSLASRVERGETTLHPQGEEDPALPPLALQVLLLQEVRGTEVGNPFASAPSSSSHFSSSHLEDPPQPLHIPRNTHLPDHS